MDERGSGWTMFAAIVLMTAGIMRIFDAIWAWRYKGALPDGLQDALIGENLKNYGWLWFCIGVLLILAGFAVVAKSQFARWIGIIAAVVAGVSAMTWIPYYPVWSIMYVAIAFMVIYALAVYGGRDELAA